MATVLAGIKTLIMLISKQLGKAKELHQGLWAILSGGTECCKCFNEIKASTRARDAAEKSVVLSHRKYLLISSRNSTPPQNRQAIVNYY